MSNFGKFTHPVVCEHVFRTSDLKDDNSEREMIFITFDMCYFLSTAGKNKTVELENTIDTICRSKRGMVSSWMARTRTRFHHP